MPNSSYALVAEIVQEHKIGKMKRTVPGSRHFKSGETVIFADAYWGMGAERKNTSGSVHQFMTLLHLKLRCGETSLRSLRNNDY